MTSTDELVNDRRKTHGSFTDHARATQRLKEVIMSELLERHKRGQEPLSFTQSEAIEMIVHKLGRIVAGDAGFADHWNDIAGYAKIANGQGV